jgi:hypothetical protein
MTDAVTIVLGLAAAALLLAAGYFIGIQRHRIARDNLRLLNRSFARDLARYREQPTILQRDDGDLRAAVETVLGPLAERARLDHDLAHLGAAGADSPSLPALLDEIALRGNFSAVMLGDMQGLRIAASTAIFEPERLAATTALLVMAGKRIGRDGQYAPNSLMVHNGDNTTTLCRLFSAGGQPMTLTVVAAGGDLPATAVDPALVRIGAVLRKRAVMAAEDAG